jgi:hypothetical protein
MTPVPAAAFPPDVTAPAPLAPLPGASLGPADCREGARSPDAPAFSTPLSPPAPVAALPLDSDSPVPESTFSDAGLTQRPSRRVSPARHLRSQAATVASEDNASKSPKRTRNSFDENIVIHRRDSDAYCVAHRSIGSTVAGVRPKRRLSPSHAMHKTLQNINNAKELRAQQSRTKYQRGGKRLLTRVHGVPVG